MQKNRVKVLDSRRRMGESGKKEEEKFTVTEWRVSVVFCKAQEETLLVVAAAKLR